MEFRSGTILVALSIVLMTCSFHGESKPLHHHEMDKIDVCIFTCDYCFKGDFVVACANDCLAMEGVMGPLWSRNCPFFQKQAESQQSNTNINPFK